MPPPRPRCRDRRRSRPEGRRSDRRAAAGQPPQRSRGDPSGSRRRRRRRSAAGCRRRSSSWRGRRTSRTDLLQPLEQLDPRPLIVDGRADDVLGVADVALVASGTVTVQAALHECPMVVVLPAVAADLSARPPVRPRRHFCDGQPGGGQAGRARAHSGRLPTGAGGGREALGILTDPAARRRDAPRAGRSAEAAGRQAGRAHGRQRQCWRSRGVAGAEAAAGLWGRSVTGLFGCGRGPPPPARVGPHRHAKTGLRPVAAHHDCETCRAGPSGPAVAS